MLGIFWLSLPFIRCVILRILHSLKLRQVLWYNCLKGECKYDVYVCILFISKTWYFLKLIVLLFSVQAIMTFELLSWQILCWVHVFHWCIIFIFVKYLCKTRWPCETSSSMNHMQHLKQLSSRCSKNKKWKQ